MTKQDFNKMVQAISGAISLAYEGKLLAQPLTDYPLAACDCAAALTGSNQTSARMFNKKFRDDAINFMCETAMKEVGREVRYA